MSMDLGHKQLFIIGCPRSGTSITAGIAHLCGAFMGECGGPSPYNAKGFFENLRIREEVIKPVLRGLGIDDVCQDILDSPADFPEEVVDAKASIIRESLLRILSDEGWRGEGWVVKEPKIVLLWQFFKKAFPSASWLIVRRDREAIVDDCLRTPFMRFHKTREGWRLWVKAHMDRINSLIEKHRVRHLLPCGVASLREVYPQKIIDEYGEAHRYSELGGLITWMLPSASTEQFDDCLHGAEEFVDPSLW